jgi:hypothetical protein
MASSRRDTGWRPPDGLPKIPPVFPLVLQGPSNIFLADAPEAHQDLTNRPTFSHCALFAFGVCLFGKRRGKKKR